MNQFINRYLRAFLTVIALLLVASVSAAAAIYTDGDQNFISQVDQVIKNGPYTGFKKTYPSYYATPGVDITGNIYSNYCCFMGVFYTPDLKGKEYDTEEDRIVPRASNEFAYIREFDSNGIKRVPFTVYKTGETVTLENQTNAIGTFQSTIYVKRNGEWQEVSQDSNESTIENEHKAAIASYTIQDGDSALKLRNHYELIRIDGSVKECDLYFMVYITDKPFTDKQAFLISIFIIAAVTLTVLIFKKHKIKNNVSEK